MYFRPSASRRLFTGVSTLSPFSSSSELTPLFAPTGS